MKIISGGQTGADQAGLAAAKELGLETGGWLPKGCVTEEGSRKDLLELYNMKEHPKRGYPPRTERNVLDSDATVIFGNADSPGCKLTVKYCTLYNKPYLHIPMNMLIDMAAAKVYGWLLFQKPHVLNVAGNRESTNFGIFDFTKAVLIMALE